MLQFCLLLSLSMSIWCMFWHQLLYSLDKVCLLCATLLNKCIGERMNKLIGPKSCLRETNIKSTVSEDLKFFLIVIFPFYDLLNTFHLQLTRHCSSQSFKICFNSRTFSFFKSTFVRSSCFSVIENVLILRNIIAIVEEYMLRKIVITYLRYTRGM